MPRSLFLKIFLWFGTVVLTVIVGTFIVGQLMRPELHAPPTRRPMDQILNEYAQEAARQYEQGGQPALIAYLDRVQSESNIRAFLFNSQLQELTGRRIPANAQTLARRVFETQRPQFTDDGSPPLFARPALTDGGAEYALVAESPRRSQFLFHPIVHLLAIVLTGGLFCYWLARYLTSPVTKLRAATRELANGNLDARVMPALGNRRDELASLAADFDLMAEKIQSLVDSQRRLLGDISHELRSPLARLQAAIGLVRQSPAKLEASLDRIEREVTRLDELVGEVLTLARLESGAMGAPLEDVDLAEVVADVAADARFEAETSNRTLSLRSVARVQVRANGELLHRAVENVVRNAVKYTADGTTVELELSLAGGRARLVVSDRGPGIPAGEIERVFEPFYRSSNDTAQGFGLGLAIAQRAISTHGGSIRAENRDGGGLRVEIQLPLASAD